MLSFTIRAFAGLWFPMAISALSGCALSPPTSQGAPPKPVYTAERVSAHVQRMTHPSDAAVLVTTVEPVFVAAATERTSTVRSLGQVVWKEQPVIRPAPLTGAIPAEPLQSAVRPTERYVFSVSFAPNSSVIDEAHGAVLKRINPLAITELIVNGTGSSDAVAASRVAAVLGALITPRVGVAIPVGRTTKVTTPDDPSHDRVDIDLSSNQTNLRLTLMPPLSTRASLP